MRLGTALAFLIPVLCTVASAGEFTYPIRSTQISVDPPRYRFIVGFFNRYFISIYGIRAESQLRDTVGPTSKILEATGPSWMHVVMNGDGWPTWIADQNWPVWNDSIEVVTSEPLSCVTLTFLIPPSGTAYKTSADNCLAADQVTPTRAETWGKLRTLYR